MRPDAPLVLGAALASRGGDLGNDLASLRKRKIPVFTLETATSYPDVYKGRQIVFVARVDTLEPDRGSMLVTLSEQALMARSSGQTTEWKGDSYRGQDSHGRNFAIESNEYGHYESKTRYSNNLEETGTVVQARLAKPDPFFEPGRSYLIVARFGGLKQAENGENGSPVVTIDGYYELGTHDLLE
ncbi:MAG: hypothetical protein QM704_10860 [Anaeromyxobacteraceae bacterium]